MTKTAFTVGRHELHPAATSERGLSLYIALAAGVASLQLGNDQGAGFAEGRYTPLIDPALAMYASYFAPEKPAGWTP